MSELALYKQQQINKLKADYNTSVKNLTTKFNTDTATLKTQKNISPLFKARSLAKITDEYKTALQKLSNKLANDIKAINKLTKVPYAIVNKALLVGINYYNTENQLYGCINDTKNLKQLLINQYNFQESNIVVLTDDLTNTNTLLLPSKANILANLKSMLLNSRAGDKLFFGYSGHGSYIIDRSGDETDGYDSVLVPIDAVTNYNNLIVDDEIKDILDVYLKDGVTLFALLDCCFSGTAMDLKYNYYDSDNGNNITMNFNESLLKGDVVMISGCKDNQTSADAVFYDASNNVIYGGALTYSFLETLKANKYLINYKNLLQNMRTILKQQGYTQIPQISSGKTLDVNANFNI